MKEEWIDGSFELDMEFRIVVNYQEIREKLYYQVFLKSDEKGECDLKPHMCKEDVDFIEVCIIDALGEIDENE